MTTHCAWVALEIWDISLHENSDWCNNWLHLKCVGYSRRSLPKEFECMFCAVQASQLEPPQKVRGRPRPRRLAEEGPMDSRSSVASTLWGIGGINGR